VPPAQIRDRLAPAFRGKDKHRSDAAVHARKGTGQHCAVKRQIAKRLLVGVEVAGQRPEHARAVMECQRPQVRPADRAGMRQHCARIERIIAGRAITSPVAA